MILTKIQKKELAGAFNASGLVMSHFIWPLGEADFYIKYKYDFHSFAINRVESDEYDLSYTQTHSPTLVQRKRTWARTIMAFESWCRGLSNELATITGWENIENSRIFGATSGDINEPIQDSDKIFFREGLLFLAEQIQDLGILTEEQYNTTNTKFNELNKKIDTHSRFDWLALCTGTVAGLIQYFGLPPETAGLFWVTAQNAFNNFRLK